jgi:acyl carrier protein
MAHLDTYNSLFIDSFGLSEGQLDANLTYQSVEGWDSVGHMQLIAGLEDAFDIMFDTDDIIDFNSYETGKQILKRYDVEL